MQLWKEWEVAMHPWQKEGGWQPWGLPLCGWFEEACSDLCTPSKTSEKREMGRSQRRQAVVVVSVVKAVCAASNGHTGDRSTTVITHMISMSNESMHSGL